jgi:PAS domain S-box-containing protein
MAQTLAGEDLRLLEQLEAGIVAVDRSGAIVLWNAVAERILGLPADAVLGRNWEEILSLVGGDLATTEDLRPVLRRAQGWQGHIRVKAGKGEPRWLHMRIQPAKPESKADQTGWAAIFWPAPSESAAPEGELPRELPYRAVFRQSSDALLLTDLDGTVIEANEVAARMLGLAEAELAGRPLFSMIEHWSPADTDAARTEAVANGSVAREITIKLPTGEVRQVKATASVISTAEGGLALVRLRELRSVRQMGTLLRNLDDLADLARSPMEVADIATRAAEMLAPVWKADAAIVLTTDPNAVGMTVRSQDCAPDSTRLSRIGPNSGLTSYVLEAGAPVEIDVSHDDVGPELAEPLRSLGCRTLRAAPIRFGDHVLGAFMLFWKDAPLSLFESQQFELAGRLVGIAIGNAELRSKMRQQTELRVSLESSARIGGVVMSQMADAIVTTDRDGRITGFNPAAQREYGIAPEEAIGRPEGEVLEQLRLDGKPLGRDVTEKATSVGYWQGRVIHRPLVGTRAGSNLVVDLGLTAIRDDQRRPAGFIALSREVTAATRLESEAAALSSLAVATGRARSRRDAAEAALERLCEATMADAGLLISWAGPGRVVEASRGLGDPLLEVVAGVGVPALRQALVSQKRVMSLESVPGFLPPDVAKVLARENLQSGFLVDLRSRDESVGCLALASRNPAWARPSDEMIQQAAALVSVALENARLMERLEHGLDEERRLTTRLETLVNLTLLPQGDITEEALARFLLEHVAETLGATGGLVVRAGADGLRAVASLNTPRQMVAVIESRPPESFSFWRRLKETADAGAFHIPVAMAEMLPDDEAGMARNSVTSYATFPIRDGDQLIGALLCHFGRQAGAMIAGERTIDAVGRIVSIAYANQRMSIGLGEAAEHERRLSAELRALQELTLLGASSDDLGRLAQETIEAVVVAAGASGGGYILVDPASARVDPIVWVGQQSQAWAALSESPIVPGDWPPLEQLQSGQGIWLSAPRETAAPDGEPAAGWATGKRGKRRNGLPRPQVLAQAVLPLRVDDRLAGVLDLEWVGQPRPEQFDVHFLEPIARICSISLANFRLRSELLHRAAAQRALGHRLDTLDELTRIGEEASSFEELAHRTVSLVREALNASGVCYLLIEPGHHFETHAVAGETGAFRLWLKGVPAKDAPGGSLLLSGGGSVLGDFVPSQVSERVLPLARATGFRSFGAIPIRTGEELAGALLCFFEQPSSGLPLDDAALDSVARIAGIALANYRLRERLVSSEERYRTLFEESPDALLVSALDGTVLDANEAAVRMYRVNRGEILGRYFGQLIAADEREMARRRQIVWAQGRGTFRDRGRRPDGTEFPVEVEIRVVELGGQRRFLHLVADLSDQDRLQRELLQAQKMEAIGQLVSGVAHELNNPLAAIIAFSQLIRGDERLPEDMRHDAGLLVQEADRTRRIVQNLLDFARARPPERHPTSIGALVQSVLELQSYALNTNKIQVVVDIPDRLPEVDLDRAQLQQVLLNLTINAIQAIRTRERTTPSHIWLSAALVKPGAVSSRVAKSERPAEDQSTVRITIRDDGPGVSETVRGRLFDPFFTTKQPGEGTGLGLSVSFGIVAAHGGHLWYEPGPGNVGSSFIIELPVRARSMDDRQMPFQAAAAAAPLVDEPKSRSSARRATKGPRASSDGAGPSRGAAREARSSTGRGAAAAQSAAPAPAAGPAPAVGPASRASSGHSAASPETRRPLILALDDEPSIRAFLRKALTAAGMECAPSQDGAQALDILRDTPCDVMLIDHRMAGMSGTEFYEAAIAFRPELARRAVFMSGDVLNPDLRGFATQRGIRLLAKPFDIDAVVRVVREVLASVEGDEASRIT